MRMAIVGGGPAGLYFAYLWKKRHPEAQVVLHEQNRRDATFGFGVVFSDRALDFLRADDAGTADLIAPLMETWRDIALVHRGERIAIDGVGFSAIGRLDLLLALQAQAGSVGVELRYDQPLASLDEIGDVDLLVGADGVNSLVRRSFEGDFKTSLAYLDNNFVWYGTTKPFDTLTQTFVETARGAFNAHHYRYAPGMSTFIVECDRATWQRYGFAHMTRDQSRAVCQDVFADALGGHALVSNRSVWRNFPWVWNERWSFRNMVLVGDALHTAHYSIGSGTRLALEDVLALASALDAEGGVAAGLRRYEAMRRPIVEKFVGASRTSAAWYERFAEHMKLDPLDFAMSYITRSGRLDTERLRQASPRFMAAYEARHARAGAGR